MIYPTHYEQKIGFDHIRALLEKSCTSTMGLEKANEMAFSNHFLDIQATLDISEETFRLLYGTDELPEVYFHDLRQSIRKTRIEGVWLEEPDVFQLRQILESIRDIKVFFTDEAHQESYPLLYQRSLDLEAYKELIKAIHQMMGAEAILRDDASAALAEIRRSLRSAQGSLSKKMQSLMRKAQDDGYVEKGSSPGIRDGRLVIPVSPMYKRKIRGIVHDESATGKTVFIEPEELVEVNNRIRELENEERREIIRILVAFTDRIRPEREGILFLLDFLGDLDFLFAKARLASTWSAIRPEMRPEPHLDWKSAVHPLLFVSLKKQGKQVVPLNIHLNAAERILIISGPNAGGKSVCLKTVGLLQYMLQCGMMIPIREDSVTGCFERLFIDIGDEQSIENDLSTYSSHLLNMKHFLKHSQQGTLLLIDEFGTGTEPTIGGAIAEACLDRFNQQGAFGVITTHYTNIKHYANEHPGILNGAMLYDRHEMRPLFQLEIGRPGSSFAVEIARKIGLPEDVIAEASNKVGSEYIDMDKYLQDIVRDKRYWEKKRLQIRQQEKKLETTSESVEQALAELQQKRKEILSTAKKEAEQLLKDSNAKIENTIRSIKEAQAEKERTRKLRQELKQFETEVHAQLESNTVDTDAQRQLEKIKRREDRKRNKTNKPGLVTTAQPKATEPKVVVWNVGDAVKMKGQTSVGSILQLEGKKALVGFGMLKTWVELVKLDKTKAVANTTQSETYMSRSSSDALRERKLNFKTEIDVRGMRGDEALTTIMHYIDDALMTNVTRVRILHGTGTGALRQLIRQYLGTVQGVTDYHDEHIQFGGTGITVVEFES